MLTVAQAAKRANRDPETIRRWIRAGKLLAWKVGSQHVIDEDALSDALGGIIATRTGPGGVDRLHEVQARYMTSAEMAAPSARPAIDPWLPEIVGRIVRAFDPARIVLFGSRARGDERPDSDYDLLILLDEVEDRRAARIEIRRLLDDLPISKDVIVAPVVAVDDPDRRPGGVLFWALQEGRTIYARR